MRHLLRRQVVVSQARGTVQLLSVTVATDPSPSVSWTFSRPITDASGINSEAFTIEGVDVDSIADIDAAAGVVSVLYVGDVDVGTAFSLLANCGLSFGGLQAGPQSGLVSLA